MKIPSPIRLRRVALGLTLAQVAAAVRAHGGKPASATALSEWETGIRPIPPGARAAMARALKMRRLPA